MFKLLVFIKIFVMVGGVLLLIMLVLVFMLLFVCGKIVFEYKNLVNWFLVVVYWLVINVVLWYCMVIIMFVLVVLFVSLWFVLWLGSEFMLIFNEGMLLYMFVLFLGMLVIKVLELL